MNCHKYETWEHFHDGASNVTLDTVPPSVFGGVLVHRTCILIVIPNIVYLHSSEKLSLVDHLYRISWIFGTRDTSSRYYWPYVKLIWVGLWWIVPPYNVIVLPDIVLIIRLILLSIIKIILNVMNQQIILPYLLYLIFFYGDGDNHWIYGGKQIWYW